MCLVVGAVLGLAGTFMPTPTLRGLAWGLVGVVLVIGGAVLVVHHLRRGNDLVAAGFVVFCVGRGLVLSGAGMTLEASIPSFAAGAALWAASLVLVSLPRGFLVVARITGFIAAARFATQALQVFSGSRLTAMSEPLPFFAYRFLAATMLGWAWASLGPSVAPDGECAFVDARCSRLASTSRLRRNPSWAVVREFRQRTAVPPPGGAWLVRGNEVAAHAADRDSACVRVALGPHSRPNPARGSSAVRDYNRPRAERSTAPEVDMTPWDPTEPGAAASPVDTLLLEVLDADPDARDDVLQRLCDEHAEHAVALRRRWRLLEPLSCVGNRRENDRPAVLERLGPFQIVRTIGAGGMGTVYLAYQEDLRRLVALKIVRRDLLASPRAVERFRREILAASRLDHPNICAVYQAGEIDGIPYYAMRLIEGRSLAELLATASRDPHRGRGLPLPAPSAAADDADATPTTGAASARIVSRVLALIEKVALALHEAHEAGLVHRDIKPGNIMVTVAGEPVVLDFGLAWVEGEDQEHLTQTGEEVGTPAYMSPEQVRSDRGTPDRRTDVYSLGVTLFECLTLRCPFVAPTRQDLYREIVAAPVPNPTRLNPSVPGDLRIVVETALEKDRDRRYRDCRAFAEDLRRVLERRPILARPLRLELRALRWAQRNAIALAFVIILTAGLATTLWQYVAAHDYATRLAAKVGEFDLLATVVQMELAQEKEKTTLYPAWPEVAPRLKAWLDEDWAQLDALRPALRDTVAALEARALPMIAEAQAAYDAALHEATGAFRRELDARRRSQAVREGAAFRPGKLPLALEDATAAALNDYAWDRVTWNESERIWNEEPDALACAEAAVERWRHDDGSAEDEQNLLDTLAWALFANGLDDRALATSRAAAGSDAAAKEPEISRARGQRLADSVAAARNGAESRRIAGLERKIEIARLGVETRGFRRFEQPTDSFLHATLSAQVIALDQMEHDTVTGVRDRVDWASRVERLSIVDHQTRWDAARRAIVSANGETASTLYAHGRRLELAPQMGLVPIGMNPVTKLWEFYHLRSADPAVPIPSERDFDSEGRLPIGDGWGLVFVLIPGGEFLMGAQNTDPDSPRFDSRAGPDEFSGATPVRLGPHFLSRYELTQGQWERMTNGERPSSYGVGTNVPPGPVNLAHPVEQVDWYMCDELLRHHGLTLPTEAQWEYACRATTSTRWHTGDDPHGLEGYANVFDEFAKAAGAPNNVGAVYFDDGYAIHAPVGTFKPNGWGLHDMHGNVWEWCRDWYGDYTHEVGEGAGLRHVTASESTMRVSRGGGFFSSLFEARSTRRNRLAPALRDARAGCRPARAIRR